jgi:ribosomal protein S8
LKEKDCIYLEVKNWNLDVESKLRNQDFINYLDIIQNENQTKIKINLNTLEDKRVWVSDFVFENKLGLIEIYKEELDLEKIFLEVTGGQK